MKKTYLYAIIGIVVLLVIILIFLISINPLNNKDANIPPSLPSNPGDTNSEISNSLIMNSKDLVGGPVNVDQVFGKWTATTEEVNGIKSEDITNYSITFNSDATYLSISHGFEQSGKFKISGNKITLLDLDVDSASQGSFEVAYIKISGNTLTLTYPSYPKVVIYTKITN